MRAKKATLTAEELLRLSTTGRRYELVKGELFEKPQLGADTVMSLCRSELYYTPTFVLIRWVRSSLRKPGLFSGAIPTLFEQRTLHSWVWRDCRRENCRRATWRWFRIWPWR